MESTTTEVTAAKDLFAGLDSFLSNKGDIEISDIDGTVVNQTPDEKEIAKKLKEKITKEKKEVIVEDDENLIDVDAVTPTTIKTVSDSTNKEVKDKPVEDTTSTEEVIEDTESIQALKDFAGALKTQGAFENLIIEEFDGTTEGLIKAIDNEAYVKANQMVDEYKDTLPPVIKYLADNYEEGVPLDQLINIKSNEIRYSSIDTDKLKEDEGLQKEVYKEFLRKTTSFSDTKILKEVNKLAELGELSTEVDEALPELIKFEKQREAKLKKDVSDQREIQRLDNEKNLTAIKKASTELKGKEIIPGIKLTDKDVIALNKSLTIPVGYNKAGNPISEIQKLRESDPIGFELKLNYIVKLTKGFTDFSEFSKKSKTGAIKTLESQLESQSGSFKGGKSANITEDDDSKSLLSAASKYIKSIKK